jgi:fluoroquinolone transport system permease protein
LRDLARALLRTIKWSGLLIGATLASAIVWHERIDPFGSPPDMILALRLAAMAVAVGMAFVLDDPSEDTTAPAPVTIMTRRLLRVAFSLPIALGVWLLLLGYSNGASYMDDESIPVWPALLEAIAFCGAALAGSALGIRFLSDRLGAPAGIGAVVSAALFVSLFPWGRQPMALFPGTDLYAREIEWWWLITLGSLVALLRMSAVPGMRLVRLRPRRSRLPAPTRPPLDPRRP